MKLNCHHHCPRRVPTAPENGAAPRAVAAPSQHGIALVITLIMLSVTLVMAVAFLALSRRERSSVSTATDTTTAKLAADSALAAAQAQIMANVLATNVGTYNFGLLISTNYISTNGFDPVLGANPLNVNYSHLYGSFGPVVGPDRIQNIANLQYLPRAPVFIQTNDLGSNDFRFYLDLNRNGTFDDTAYVDNSFTNGPTSETGDPQWVGILARPDVMHSANNQFVARYAFIALPVGNTLDINAIHNQTLNRNLNLATDGFYRNESVGSWEINLAAFLADLNSDDWDPSFNPYLYREAANPPNNNLGAAFEDAFSIVTNRYAGFYNTLAVPPSVPTIIPVGTNISLYDSLVNNGIDGYTAGSLMTGTQLPFVNGPLTGTPWAGSDNTNRFYDLPSDLFNPSATSGSFTNRLTLAGNSIATNYDRYTLYHLLAQLGTDSDPDDGKMNLNYRNITTNGVVVPGMETNCIVWSPIEFFTNAADRMLRLYTTNWFAANPSNYLATYYNITGNYRFYYYDAHNNLVTYNPNGFGLTNTSFTPFLGWTNIVPAFGITNIPVFVNGQFVYSPAVNRVLQMAANLYDASTTNVFPSVFRPIFQMDQFTNLFIVGYSEVTNVLAINPGADIQFSLPYDVSQLGYLLNNNYIVANKPFGTNIYGVPWIIGAKKNLPAFDQFTMLNSVQVNRKLQVGRNTLTSPIYTNHLYDLSISNSVGVSFWNSYSNNYVSQVYPANGVSVICSDYLQMTLTNSDLPGVSSALVFSNYLVFNTNFWSGSHWPRQIGEAPANNAFIATTWTNTFYSGVIYKTGAKVFAQFSGPDPWESNNTVCDPLPAFGLMTTNWLRAIIVDNGHVIDYVQLRGPIDGTNFTAALADPYNAPQPALWSTNAAGSGPTPSWGYVSQINISKGINTAPASAVWSPVGYPAGLNTVAAAQEYFNAFFTPSHQFTYNGNIYNSTDSVLQAGYTATRTIFVPYLYQVNDPLVHYIANDLDAGAGAVWDAGEAVPNGVWQQNNGISGYQTSYQTPNPPYGADIIKGRYQPWGVAAPTALQTGNYNFGNPYNPIYKDPGVWDPDYWNFPTNRYPTVGWIGRVHRGSPWQTVYLKATNVIVAGNVYGTNTWAAWTGDRSLYDAANSAPVQDRLLFDLFTTRANDNAARGTLSVNQTNWAAWSAIFSGMVAVSNLTVTALPTFNFTPPNGFPIPQTTTTYSLIRPVAVDGYNTGLANLVAAINAQRASTNPVPMNGFVNLDGTLGAFEHVGDILSTPALTVQSPFLNWNNINQQRFGINDAEYEWLPQQMMGLVRESPTPRYVIYGYGQALRPAPNGLYTGGGINFGLVTNYQIVAESAVRAVVSVHAQLNTSGAYPVTNYTTRVESYNVLPSQ